MFGGDLPVIACNRKPYTENDRATGRTKVRRNARYGYDMRRWQRRLVCVSLWKQYQQLVFFDGLAALYLLLSFSRLTDDADCLSGWTRSRPYRE